MKKINMALIRWSQKILLLFLSGLLVVGGLFLLWAIRLEIPSFDVFEERVVIESTKIYDRSGKVLLYDVFSNVKRRVVPFGMIAKDIKNATVAIEDSDFYNHRGVKVEAIFRALLANIGSGSIQQGGSTITQQLIKNSLLSSERRLERKIREVALAIKMEKAFSKEEILSLYLNEIPYGGNVYGVEEAAQTFFAKSAAEVTLAEAAYLAAITKAPTYFSPYGNNRDKLGERKNLVLARMADLGFITEEERRRAAEEKVVFSPPASQGIKAPHFVMFVLAHLEEKYGGEFLRAKGLKVITTLDWELQEKAERIVSRFAAENETKFNAKNAGLVALDPKTGEILAMVGSRDYFDVKNNGNFNITLARRQPGSAFKPFVYAAAFQKGFTPETVVFDLPTQFDTTCPIDPRRCYTPTNYDNKFRGPVTFREALAQSINVPAIKVLYLAGIKNAIALAKNMGITTLSNPDRYGLTLVLGGGEVTPLELTGAYGVLANNGIRLPPEKIIRVEDSAGRVLEEFSPRPRRVLVEPIARTISNILADNQARAPAFGAASPLHFPDRAVAAKTGTTNDYRDAWILGYTPSLVVGAWAGNNDNTPMVKQVAGFIIAPLWRAFMEEALAGLPEENFPPPPTAPTNPELKPALRGIWQGGRSYFIDKISQKLATEFTPPDLREEKILTGVHSILYWLDKNNPLGPAPEMPFGDPQFWLWERPVRQWAANQGFHDQNPADLPTEYDDVHLPEYRPEITVIEPRENQIYPWEGEIKIKIDYRSRFPVAQIDVFLNDNFVDSVRREPFETAFAPKEFSGTGSENTVRIIVYDSVRNRNETSIILRLIPFAANDDLDDSLGTTGN